MLETFLHSRSRMASIASLVLLAASCIHAARSEEPSPPAAHTNRLIDSNNPYLLLHAHNPVEWYPWGPDALEKAKREGKPIFLSIGYSTCYWCHVAERTLFSNPEIAGLMNQWFVNIKVDREERPDLDAVYMLATQLLTSGPGGWPNNLFLTPDLAPFYAGGYFPPEDDEFGRPGFPSVLKNIHDEWTQEPERARKRADGVLSVLRQYQTNALIARLGTPDRQRWTAQMRASALSRFDAEHGGLGTARQGTKFPQSPVLAFMLAAYGRNRDADALRFVTATLDAMAYGGIYDQLGGGFHRYSMERTWSIPHFEKMLYDNAQLLAIYSRAWELTGRAQYKRVAMGVREFLRVQMLSRQGGFYTAVDAAVDGAEGVSYLWTRAQIENLISADAQRFFEVYELTPIVEENAELDPNAARSVIRVRLQPDTQVLERKLAALEDLRAQLFAARHARAQPAIDQKMLVGLNGLAIGAFAVSGRVFHSREDIEIARHSAERIWRLAWDAKSARLSHEVFHERAQGDAFLDDYALFGQGLLALHAATKQTIWLQRARRVADALLRTFDPEGSGTLRSSASTGSLILAPMEEGDGAYPSGTSAAVDLLASLSRLTGSKQYGDAATRIVRATPGQAEKWPLLVAAVSASALFSDARPEPATRAANPVQPRDTAAHVRASAVAESSSNEDRVAITLEVERGYHINANPASFDFLIPTTLRLPGWPAADIRYPAPRMFKSAFAPDVLKVYEGSVELVARLPTDTLAQVQSLRVTVEVQACTESICLPPSKLPITVRVTHINQGAAR